MYQQGDMAPDDFQKNVDVALYGLSLLETDVTRHLRWAASRLDSVTGINGALVIYDVAAYFPPSFKDDVEKYGFRFRSADVFGVLKLWLFYFVGGGPTDDEAGPTILMNHP